MAVSSLLGGRSDFFNALDPSPDGGYRIALLCFSSQCVVGEAHRRDVLRARKLACKVRKVTHIGRHQVSNSWFTRERQAGRPIVFHHLERELGQEASTSTQEDVRRQALAT